MTAAIDVPDDAVRAELDSPLAPLHLVASGDALCAVLFSSAFHAPAVARIVEQIPKAHASALLESACGELREYFAGTRKTFSIAVRTRGTEFQERAWAELRKIPYGETISYGVQAQRLGNANGARAVGSANGRNPVSIFVPCHRVISGGGDLTGYGGGMEAKRWLLHHEREHCERAQLSLFPTASPHH